MALDMNIRELLVIRDSNLLINQVKGNWETKNDKILPYVNLVQRLCARFKSIDFKHTPRAQNEFAGALATIASMIQHPESTHIDPLEITLREEQAHCAHVKTEPGGQPWYADIKAYLEKGKYPPESSANQKKTIGRLTTGFVLNKCCTKGPLTSDCSECGARQRGFRPYPARGGRSQGPAGCSKLRDGEISSPSAGEGG
ncbi:uncharacterized protein LOC132637651 [Lycium barbarum]|uniref:uncharacterized protein LOC132637651 n=1 Tax=Lycium barbarum TaxID=112863 RepID=UPI00293F7655|nr:uncharacterized protein LOC132637651 [Lycium barbarum]